MLTENVGELVFLCAHTVSHIFPFCKAPFHHTHAQACTAFLFSMLAYQRCADRKRGILYDAEMFFQTSQQSGI